MARPDFPLSIDRRRLLTSAAAAAATATGILPDVKPADAAAPDFSQSSELTPEAQLMNFCAATARRLAEIARRNEIRREANLPLLSISKELRRMKDQEKLEEFSRFEATYGKAVWEDVLKARRDAEGPKLRPSWMEGVHYQSEIYKILRQRFCAAGRGAGLNSGATELLKSPAVLNELVVDYTAAGGPSFYGKTSAPTFYQVTMRFTELEMWIQNQSDSPG
jgi:hypothetical protein